MLSITEVSPKGSSNRRLPIAKYIGVPRSRVRKKKVVLLLRIFGNLKNKIEQNKGYNFECKLHFLHPKNFMKEGYKTVDVK